MLSVSWTSGQCVVYALAHIAYAGTLANISGKWQKLADEAFLYYLLYSEARFLFCHPYNYHGQFCGTTAFCYLGQIFLKPYLIYIYRESG